MVYNDKNLEDKVIVIKKNGKEEEFDSNKIINAVSKAANRALVQLTEDEEENIILEVLEIIELFDIKKIKVSELHDVIEKALMNVNKDVAKSYIEWRNYKKDFARMVDKTYEKDKSIRYMNERDTSNANTDSTLVSTKRSVVYSTFNELMYEKFFLTDEENQAKDDGYIYIHDKSSRRDTFNCCLFDMGKVLEGGFTNGNIFYNEPKSLDVFGDVVADVTLCAASQEYGGFTIPEIDKTIEKYAQKSYDNYYKEFMSNGNVLLKDLKILDSSVTEDILADRAEEYALKKLQRDMEQCVQAWEYKFNSVSSSRGDYPFITMTFGLSTTKFGKMFSETMMRVRYKGQGKKGFERPVLFPKLVFLYDENLHGEGKENEDLFDLAIYSSSKCMYPDYVSLTGRDKDDNVTDSYENYGLAISPMGCRSFLSKWWERGGLNPADEDDKPVFMGRQNNGRHYAA